MARNDYGRWDERDNSRRNRNFQSDYDREDYWNEDSRGSRGRSGMSGMDRDFDLRGRSSFGRRNDDDFMGRDEGTQYYRDFNRDEDENRVYQYQTGRGGVRLSPSDRARFRRQYQNQGQDRGGHYGKGPKGWRRSDDRIKEEASEALFRDADIDASNIDLTVKDGTVYLTGTVDSRDTKRAAENCVESVSGVDDVQNDLKIQKDSGNYNEMKQSGRVSKDTGSSTKGTLS